MPRHIRLLAALLLLASAVTARVSHAADEIIVHTVVEGDTLSRIAAARLRPPYTWQQLRDFNGLRGESFVLIVPGQAIRIPRPWTEVPPATVRIERTFGAATVTAAQGPQARELQAGDRLVTGPRGRAELAMPDGSRVLIEPGTELAVGEVRADSATSTFMQVLSLVAGRVQVLATKLRGQDHAFRIITPTATIGVRGTEFRVGQDEANVSRTETLEGRVRFDQTEVGQGVDVAGGFGTLAARGAPPLPPVPLLPRPRIVSLPHLGTGAATVFRIAPVPGAAEYRATMTKNDDPNVFATVRGTGVRLEFTGLPAGYYRFAVRALDPNALEGYESTVDLRITP